MRTHTIALVFVACTALAPQPAAAQYIARVRFGPSSRVVAVERPRSLSLYDRTTNGDAKLRVETPAPGAAVGTDGHLAVHDLPRRRDQRRAGRRRAGPRVGV